jgi:hypothetical protein
MRLEARLLLTTVFCASSSVAGAKAAELSCTSPVSRESGHTQLVPALGASNIARDVYQTYGDGLNVSVVFPKDPKRRLMVFWRDDPGLRIPADVVVQPPSAWSVGGLTIGMSMADAERLNGKPFKVIDVGGDGGGWDTNWMGGRLSTLPGGCRLVVDFKTSPDAWKAAHWEPAGNIDSASSDDPALRAANPTVTKLSLRFPEPGRHR